MVETVISIPLPVHENFLIRKNTLTGGSDAAKKRISIVTGIHGDELEGQYVCFELIKRINEHPEYLQGKVDIYPAMNPMGIDSITRGFPGFDIDMNRLFPGNINGEMTEYLASEIMAELSQSTLCLDIHASNIFLREIPQVRINRLFKDELVPIAEKLNMDFIWVHDNSTVLESTLSYSLNYRHTKNLVIEMGVGMRITKAYTQQLTDGIFNVMHDMGMWLGPVKSPGKPYISEHDEDICFLNAPVAGIFISKAPHGACLEKNDLIGLIVDPLEGKILSEVRAPHAGLLFTIREYPVVNEGSLMARILKAEAL